MPMEVEAKFFNINREAVVRRLKQEFGNVKGEKKTVHDIYYIHPLFITEENYKKGASLRLRFHMDQKHRIKKVKITLKRPVSLEKGTLKRVEYEVEVKPENVDQILALLETLGMDKEEVSTLLKNADVSDVRSLVELFEKRLGFQRLYTVTKSREKYKVPGGELVIDTLRAATLRRGRRYRWGLGERTHAEIEAEDERILEELVNKLGLKEAERKAHTQFDVVKEFLGESQ